MHDRYSGGVGGGGGGADFSLFLLMSSQQQHKQQKYVMSSCKYEVMRCLVTSQTLPRVFL